MIGNVVFTGASASTSAFASGFVRPFLSLGGTGQLKEQKQFLSFFKKEKITQRHNAVSGTTGRKKKWDSTRIVETERRIIKFGGLSEMKVKSKNVIATGTSDDF